MNGIHDMGGMHGMGAIQHEKNEPVFHEAWEGRVYAMTLAMAAWGKWNIDASRHAIELLAPADYLRMSYYERWLAHNIEMWANHGLLTREEIETGKTAAGSQKATPPFAADALPAMTAFWGSSLRPDVGAEARFKVGEHVRARNINPVGHTRLPRYARGREGVIARRHGIFVFPDTNAHFLGEHPQHLYSVRFAARELWGDAASPKDCVYLDMWDSYLEHV